MKWFHTRSDYFCFINASGFKFYFCFPEDSHTLSFKAPAHYKQGVSLEINLKEIYIIFLTFKVYFLPFLAFQSFQYSVLYFFFFFFSSSALCSVIFAYLYFSLLLTFLLTLSSFVFLSRTKECLWHPEKIDIKQLSVSNSTDFLSVELKLSGMYTSHNKKHIVVITRLIITLCW